MYKLIKHTSEFTGTTSEGVLHKPTGLFIPIDEQNKDYQTYLKWLDGYERVSADMFVKTSEGNTPEPADE